jgi:hypothetical protein
MVVAGDEVMAQQPRVRLRDGNTIPPIGLGLWQVDSGLTARVVSEGIKAGYRLIDTAEGYNNEEGVGQAIREAEVPRSELFITSKLRNGGHARDLALRSFDDTMTKLGIQQLDLFLIHWPIPSRGQYVEAWKTLVELKQQAPRALHPIAEHGDGELPTACPDQRRHIDLDRIDARANRLHRLALAPGAANVKLPAVVERIAQCFDRHERDAGLGTYSAQSLGIAAEVIGGR